MTQTSKKPVGQPSAKLASNAANKAAKSNFTAVETTRSSAENVVKIGGKAVKDFMSSSADEAQKAQEKVFAMSREGAEQLAKGADVVTKALYETISLSRDNFETAIECGNMTASLAKDVSGELFEAANKSFSDNVELSKEFFSCRTLNDLFDLQNRIVRSSIDNYFNETVKLSGMMFEYTQEALEPINERVAQASDQITKIMSAK
jgi:phasin family protein